ncbi:MAG: hypothetical protein WCL50_01220 [Spirochaetota bacterium]
MPRIKDLERFQRDLVALARENEVLAQWGEVREDPPLPSDEPKSLSSETTVTAPKPSRSADIPPDFADLLSKAPVGTRVGPTSAGGPEPDTARDSELDALLELPPDEPAAEIDSELDALLGLDSTPEEEPEASSSSEDAGGFDLAAFASAMEESSLDDAIDPAVSGLPDPAELPPDFGSGSGVDLGPGPSEAGPEAAVPDDFSMPDFDSFDLPGESSPTMGESLEPEPPSEALTDAKVEESFDLGSLEDLGELDSADLGEAAPLEAAPEGESASESPTESDDFGIPDFGDSTVAPSQEEAPAARAAPPSALPSEDLALPGDIDAFDSFSFDEPEAPNLAGEALDRELATLGEPDDASPTFNLEGGWNGFGGVDSEEAPPKAPSPRVETAKRSEGKIRTVALTEAQVDKLQDWLLALPLNLRVAVEDIVANEKGSEGQRSNLVWSLVEHEKVQDIASAAGKILKRRIPIPEGYSRRTGAGYLAEKGSLRHLLVHTILPVARTALLVLLFAGALGYLGYRFIYRPLAATALYRTGYERILQGRYPEAEDAFARATAIREFVPWYYRYAEAYVSKRHFIYAENKYAELLKRHPTESAGALAWARLERDQLKYRDAITILDKHIIDRKPLDKEALLLEGDVFLDWAEEDAARFGDARKRFATLIQAYGAGDLYLERMLAYFIRTDMLKEVLPLKSRFLAMKDNPLGAGTMAELGGYLLDKNEMTDDFRILKGALARDANLPEAHFQLFRYYRKAGSPVEETKALDKAITGFDRLPALDKRRLSMYLESLVTRGDLRLRAGEFLTAEEDYGKAAVAYEHALSLDRLKKTPGFGKAYAGLGDVAYWGKDDLVTAKTFYEKAADHGWDNPELRYRRGFIDYRRGDYASALEHFYRASEEGGENPRLLYALGNSFAARADWHAAGGYFRRLVDRLGDTLQAMDYPLPQEKPSDRALIEVLMASENNLGVSLFNLGNRTGNPKLKSEAIVSFTESARLFDLLVHDARSLVGANQANLGYANLNYVLNPRRGIGLSAYSSITKDDEWADERVHPLSVARSPAEKPAAEAAPKKE